MDVSPLAGWRTNLDEIEWDEDKRLSNLAKHRIDFNRAMLIFDGRPAIDRESPYPDEERWLRTGIIDERFVTVVWTWRQSTIRIISARIARHDERREYRAIHDDGDSGKAGPG